MIRARQTLGLMTLYCALVLAEGTTKALEQEEPGKGPGEG